MQRMMMKSKLHRATVTGADLEYEGSVTLDPNLMQTANILHNERVEIYDVTNGNRFATYAIPGHPGAGEVVLNGAAAHQVTPGDLVILCTYGYYDDVAARNHTPTVIFVDEHNRPTERRGEKLPA